MPFHPGGGHYLERGADRGVGDEAGGVLRVGLRRYRQGEALRPLACLRGEQRPWPRCAYRPVAPLGPGRLAG